MRIAQSGPGRHHGGGHRQHRQLVVTVPAALQAAVLANARTETSCDFWVDLPAASPADSWTAAKHLGQWVGPALASMGVGHVQLAAPKAYCLSGNPQLRRASIQARVLQQDVQLLLAAVDPGLGAIPVQGRSPIRVAIQGCAVVPVHSTRWPPGFGPAEVKALLAAQDPPLLVHEVHRVADRQCPTACKLGEFFITMAVPAKGLHSLELRDAHGSLLAEEPVRFSTASGAATQWQHQRVAAAGGDWGAPVQRPQPGQQPQSPPQPPPPSPAVASSSQQQPPVVAAGGRRRAPRSRRRSSPSRGLLPPGPSQRRLSDFMPPVVPPAGASQGAPPVTPVVPPPVASGRVHPSRRAQVPEPVPLHNSFGPLGELGGDAMEVDVLPLGGAPEVLPAGPVDTEMATAEGLPTSPLQQQPAGQEQPRQHQSQQQQSAPAPPGQAAGAVVPAATSASVPLAPGQLPFVRVWMEHLQLHLESRQLVPPKVKRAAANARQGISRKYWQQLSEAFQQQFQAVLAAGPPDNQYDAPALQAGMVPWINGWLRQGGFYECTYGELHHVGESALEETA